MSRGRLREWKNGKYPKWTCRIIWFGIDFDSDEDIRLHMEDCAKTASVLPKTHKAAEKLWQLFKKGAPPTGQKTPFVEDLLKLINSSLSSLAEMGEGSGLKYEIKDSVLPAERSPGYSKYKKE